MGNFEPHAGTIIISVLFSLRAVSVSSGGGGGGGGGGGFPTKERRERERESGEEECIVVFCAAVQAISS